MKSSSASSEKRSSAAAGAVLAGRACVFGGAAALICSMLGLATVTSVRMIVGITVALDGLVLMGSRVASTAQLELPLKQAEDQRSAAIDALFKG